MNDRKILSEEVVAVLEYRKRHPDIGYRKLTYQMIDENICALSETAVYNILQSHNMLSGWASSQGFLPKRSIATSPSSRTTTGTPTSPTSRSRECFTS